MNSLFNFTLLNTIFIPIKIDFKWLKGSDFTVYQGHKTHIVFVFYYSCVYLEEIGFGLN